MGRKKVLNIDFNNPEDKKKYNQNYYQNKTKLKKVSRKRKVRLVIEGQEFIFKSKQEVLDMLEFI